MTTMDIWRGAATRYAKGAPHRPVRGLTPATCESCHGLIGWSATEDPIHAVPGQCACGAVVAPFRETCPTCRARIDAQREAERAARMGQVSRTPEAYVPDREPREATDGQGEASAEYVEARAYVLAYTGSFDFLLSMKDRLTGPRGVRGPLSEKMVAAILRCKAAEVARAAQKPTQPRVQTGRDLTVLPIGRTSACVPNESGGLTFLLIDRPTANSKWAGWVFVKQQQGPNEVRLGSQRPGESYVGSWPALIDAVIADPMEAVARYGRELGICGVCHLALTNEESRELGIGPVCRQKIGA